MSQPIITLTDADSPLLRDYTGLTDVVLRTRLEPENGLYMAESEKVIRRALAVGHRPRSMLLSNRWAQRSADLIEAVAATGAPVYLGEPAVLEQITGFNVHRGAIAAMHRPVLPEVAPLVAGARRVVILEDIVDHTNVGAIFRSVAAIGADAVLVTPGCADPLYRRAVRVSMGTVFQVPWTRIPVWPDGLTELREAGFTVAALALTGDAVSLDAFGAAVPERLALILGTEGDGLSPQTLAQVDVAVQIPMAGQVDSLNVNATAAVALWETRVR